MGWNGGYGFKNSKKINIGPCEKKPPLFHTLRGHGSRLMPYSYCAVRLCLLRHLRMQMWDKFARSSRELVPDSRTGMHAHLNSQ